MKTFYFGNKETKKNPFEIIFNDTKTDDNNNFIDNLLKKAYNKYIPWAKPKTEDKYEIITIPYIDLPYKLINITPSALNLELNKAISNLGERIYYAANPTYDFMIGDHAVKIHGNYIQIDHMILPKDFDIAYLNTLDKKTRITLYEISLSINSYTLELAA